MVTDTREVISKTFKAIAKTNSNMGIKHRHRLIISDFTNDKDSVFNYQDKESRIQYF